MNFPVYLRVGSIRIHPHIFFEATAYAIAFGLFFLGRRRQGDPISVDFRWWVIAAAVAGAALGCRLLGWLESPRLDLPTTGKTIVGGLAGGLIAVFLTGLSDGTYGNPTSLPWGVDFGDGIARHPTQLYEIAFAAMLVLCLFAFSRRPHAQGDVFKVFMISYMAWRLLVDFVKPANRVFGVSPIQVVCLLILIYYSRHFVRIAKSFGRHGVFAAG